MSSLALYRGLVPSHSAVLDGTVTTWLELAARRHNAEVFGAVYPEAMVFWAAHRIERLPGSGAGGGSGSEVGVVTSQTDGDLSRSYAVPSASSVASADADLATTRFGLMYLELRDSRAGIGPDNVPPWA